MNRKLGSYLLTLCRKAGAGAGGAAPVVSASGSRAGVCGGAGGADGSGGARVLVRAAGTQRGSSLSEPALGPEDWRCAVSRLARAEWRRVVHAARCTSLPSVRSSDAVARAVRRHVAAPAAG